MFGGTTYIDNIEYRSLGIVDDPPTRFLTDGEDSRGRQEVKLRFAVNMGVNADALYDLQNLLSFILIGLFIEKLQGSFEDGAFIGHTAASPLAAACPQLSHPLS